MLDACPDLADDVVLDRESPLAFEMLGCVLEVATYVLDVSAELGLVHGRRYRLRKRRTQVQILQTTILMKTTYLRKGNTKV